MPIAEARLPIVAEEDIVSSRQRAREVARQLGFGAVDQSRIATAVSELARNVVRYATDGRGEVAIRELAAAGRTGIEIVVSDDGPGIRTSTRRSAMASRLAAAWGWACRGRAG